jgi:endonuclease G
MKSRNIPAFAVLLLCFFSAFGFTKTNLLKEDPFSFDVEGQHINYQPLTSDLPAPIPAEEVVKHTYYTLSYNDKYELANWVSYTLKSSMLTGKAKRKDDYRRDPLLRCGSAKPSDYFKSNFDKGHLLPAGDMSFSDEAVSETFFMSNMCPQKPGFNRGIWKKLEDQVRGWAILYSELHICTGPVISKGTQKIGAGQVAVPSYYYKLVLDYRQPGIKAIAFIMPNESSDKPLEDYAVSIDSVENFTGINFFASLSDSIENLLESKINLSDWNFTPYVHKDPGGKKNVSVGSAAQCKALTKKGERCRRKTNYENGFCGQHGGK